MANLRCTYPSHASNSGEAGWNDGVLGTTTVLSPGVICPGCAAFAGRASVVAAATDGTRTANQSTIIRQAQGALTTNTTYLAIGSPSNAQVVAQVRALTQQNNRIIRLLLSQIGDRSQLDATS